MSAAALIADTDSTFIEAVREALAPHALEITVVANLSAAALAQPWALIVVNHDVLGVADAALLRALLEDPVRRRHVLVHTATCERAALAALFGETRLLNLLGRGAALDAVDLQATVTKILRGDIFGVEKYFVGVPPESLQRLELALTSSAARHAAFQQISAFAADSGVGGRFVERLEIVSDELITNAMYNAPVDGNGRARFSHLSRREDFELEAAEAIRVTVLCGPQRVGIGVRDPFGSLATETVLHYLAKCLRAGEDQIDDKPGGAGLGLFTCFEALSHFVINLSRGHATEMIGLIHVTASFREFARRSKSLNVFVMDDQ